MTKIKKTDNTKCWWRRKITGTYILVGGSKWYYHFRYPFGSVLRVSSEIHKQLYGISFPNSSFCAVSPLLYDWFPEAPLSSPPVKKLALCLSPSATQYCDCIHIWTKWWDDRYRKTAIRVCPTLLGPYILQSEKKVPFSQSPRHLWTFSATIVIIRKPLSWFYSLN